METYVNETYELIHLTIDHEEITTTPGHPFYVKNIGFVKAGDLVEGAILIDEEGNELHLQTKKWEYLQDPAIVYNFAVEVYHTYYVGYNRVLVHNMCDMNVGDGPNSSVYRGGKDFTVKPNEVRFNKITGNVKTTHGVSVNLDPNSVSKFGGAYKIDGIPDGLKIIQRGANPSHFEIVPTYEMPLETFQMLLNKIPISGPF